MTKQRPASLDGSLLVKKGQAQPSVAPTTDPVTKKVSRFPDPNVDVPPLTSTPPISELYGTGSSNDEPLEPTFKTQDQAADIEPTEPQSALPNVANQNTLTGEEDDKAVDDAPEPRLVVLLPRPSFRTLVSLLLVSLMGFSAWYLMTTSENTGTQRLASVSVSDDAAIGDENSASAISPPPSGIISEATVDSTGAPQTIAAKTGTKAGSSSGSSTNTPVPEAKPVSVVATSSTTTNSAPQFAIQLLATKSTQAGEAAWKQISAKHKAQLDGLGLDLQTVTLQGRGKFVRVRAGPIAERKLAVNRCKALSSAGQDCLVVRF